MSAFCVEGSVEKLVMVTKSEVKLDTCVARIQFREGSGIAGLADVR